MKKPAKARNGAKAKQVLEKGHAAGQLEGLYRAMEKPMSKKGAGKTQTPKG